MRVIPPYGVTFDVVPSDLIWDEQEMVHFLGYQYIRYMQVKVIFQGIGRRFREIELITDLNEAPTEFDVSSK